MPTYLIYSEAPNTPCDIVTCPQEDKTEPIPLHIKEAPVRLSSHEPCPQAEKYIIQDPIEACFYARYVLDERWPEAEPIILTNPQTTSDYEDHFNCKLTPNIENQQTAL